MASQIRIILILLILSLGSSPSPGDSFDNQALAPRSASFVHYILKPTFTRFLIIGFLLKAYIATPESENELVEFWGKVFALRFHNLHVPAHIVIAAAITVINYIWLCHLWPRLDQFLRRSS